MSNGNELRPYQVAQALPLLRWIGFEVGLDLDGELEIQTPDAISGEFLVKLLRWAEKDVKQAVERQAARERMQCVGGPMNGRRHDGHFWQPLLFHAGRAKWHVYRVSRDGRAFYLGDATSRNKARSLWVRHAERIEG